MIESKTWELWVDISTGNPIVRVTCPKRTRRTTSSEEWEQRDIDVTIDLEALEPELRRKLETALAASESAEKS